LSLSAQDNCRPPQALLADREARNQAWRATGITERSARNQAWRATGITERSARNDSQR
jgi:hypothetical protein